MSKKAAKDAIKKIPKREGKAKVKSERKWRKLL